MTTAASAASDPALPLSPPERASACSRVSVVSTPNAHGTPVYRPTALRPVAAALQMWSKWAVSPRMTTPRAMIAA